MAEQGTADKTEGKEGEVLFTYLVPQVSKILKNTLS